MYQYCNRHCLLWIITTVLLIHSAESVNASAHNNVSYSKPIIKLCNRKHPDGTEYSGPCPTPVPEGHSSPVTDSEVSDLLKHKTTDNPQTQGQPLSSIDQIVKPEEKLSSNSKFNANAAKIAALICLGIAVVFYVGIRIWKQIDFNGYYNREILLNDEDIGDINDEDMRHFEAACIQIET